ncbi:sel1 repeat family protein [Alkalicaulis satelles]|uniref:Sel1 repeat family protein n=1 Tax=Alkalicaulis satelles TaxID=2609175 RepID=A0A5M6ZNG6_9PROT|nr:sel1 repeat family protein [Alkalicaulis satelles]KAA5805455.1 sel1 repeat family protein [Alkalicaulis satelles]
MKIEYFLKALCLAAVLWLFASPAEARHANPMCSLSAISDDAQMCRLSPAVSAESCHEMGIGTLQLPDSCLAPGVRTLGALNLFEAACDRGYGPSCVYGAVLIVQRYAGIDQDFTRAHGLASTGCEADDADSCSMLAFFYVNAAGVERNIPAARTALEKACALGSQEGCTMIDNLPAN